MTILLLVLSTQDSFGSSILFYEKPIIEWNEKKKEIKRETRFILFI